MANEALTALVLLVVRFVTSTVLLVKNTWANIEGVWEYFPGLQVMLP
jgi:hypothetical protein